MADSVFSTDCQRCPRLAEFLRSVKSDHPDYFCKPVPPFGEERPRLLIVGLAPGMHGANATGRPFTGDHAGILLYETMHRHGFASSPVSTAADDGLVLVDCAITNAVKCLPPENKPLTAEINTCNDYLAQELENLDTGSILIALGGIAHKAILRALGMKQSQYVFAHAAEHDLSGLYLIDSYHCSRYNTQTKRLTPAMFDAIFERARALL